ncbi:gamma-aminobutyric acid receptor subunit beta-like isoform X1 [Artemia franciscana]|uniref:Gamma-aminobutyric acid receptor subunit beta n=1 Tax=Artemia franciscana TaxID=6661 RepID=A0AA88HV87_ARTSF|nr:hypothetical protein QYM36_007144 [Artemia franciscana]
METLKRLIYYLQQWNIDPLVSPFCIFIIFSALTNFSSGNQRGSSETFNVTGILNSLQQGYDKRVRPNYAGPPVDVGITLFIVSISSMSEVGMDFTTDFYFRQYWNDNRLRYSKATGVELLSVSTEYLRNIWVPDTFFPNEKTSYFHMATTSNEFLRIKYNGDINRSIRLTVTASCPMNLQYFPMDRQLCQIEIESFGFTTAEIRYAWHTGANSVEIDQTVTLPQFQVLGYRIKSFEVQLASGNYSRLACEIQFVRSMGYYLIQIYIPSSLIVVISWVSFWLNRTATPARVSLGVTTVLTMTTLMSSTNAQLPKISYVKSIDIFLGTCFVMVFASLLEYAAVGYMAKRIETRKKRFQALQAKIIEQKKAMLEAQAGSASEHEAAKIISRVNGTPDDVSSLLPPGKDLNKMYGVTPSDIDKYSRVVFPVCFICFNLMYWIIYLHISDVVAEDLTFFKKE